VIVPFFTNLGRSRSPTDYFEDLQKELDEKHSTQLNEIKEQRTKLEQLQQQLAEEQKKQRDHQLELEQKQKELQEKQDQLVQNQIEEHKERQNRYRIDSRQLHFSLYIEDYNFPFSLKCNRES